MTMTSRERVLRALERRTTDRAPANYSAHREVTDRLRSRLGVADDEALLQALGVDLRAIMFSSQQPDSGPDAEGYLRTMWGVRYHPGKADDDPLKRIVPFNDDTTVDDVLAHRWPSADALEYRDLHTRCARYHDEYVTFGSPWCPFFHEVGWLIGQENYFVWMHTKPEVVDAITDGIVTYEIAVTRRYLAACDGKLDIAYFGNDFGTQRGLFISPAQWRRFLRAPLKRYFDAAHDFGCRVMQHSCGSVRAIVPDLLADGVDILDPIQVRADGMSLESLVRDFGDRLAFHGGMDTQHTLPFESPAEVRAMVRGYRDLTRDRGGYIMSGSQELIADIPDDNILAMYDEHMKG